MGLEEVNSMTGTPPKHVEETGDIFCRRVYVVTPNERLLELVEGDFPDELQDIKTPVVVMTEELLFERYLEGWRRQILSKCKEMFLGGFVESRQAGLADLLKSEADEKIVFDDWFTATEAESIELVTNSWKDR